MRAREPLAVGRDDLDQLIHARWTPEAFRRFQCVWLAERLQLPALEIAAALGLHISTVRRIQADFAREGVQAILGRGNRGGRRNQCLSPEEEAAFLRGHPELFGRTGAADVGALKAAFELRVGRRVHKTTIYRLLERHGRRRSDSGRAGQEVSTPGSRRKGVGERRKRGGRVR